MAGNGVEHDLGTRPNVVITVFFKGDPLPNTHNNSLSKIYRLRYIKADPASEIKSKVIPREVIDGTSAERSRTGSVPAHSIEELEGLLHHKYPHSTCSHRRLAAHVAELTLSTLSPIPIAPDSLRTHPDLLAWEHRWAAEAVWQRASVHRTHKRLAVFDMDSTLIQQEVIDELARTLGVGAEVSAITARAMDGELDFAASLRARCALLRGAPSTVFEELRAVVTLTPGASDLVRALKRLGVRTAVLSGGFAPLATWLARRLGLDHAVANRLVVGADGAALTGELEGELVDAEAKREHVVRIAREEGVLLEQTLVVGDGANDLLMMGVAGLGVAFNAKPKVQLVAPARLNAESLREVLFLMGFSVEEQEELLV